MNDKIHELFEKSSAPQQRIEKGHAVFLEDSPIRGMYLLHRGKIKLVKYEEDGKEIILRISGAGEIVGHRCFFYRETYGVSAVALEECELSFLPKSQLMSALKEEHELLFQFLRVFSEELHEEDKKLSLLMRKNVGERIAEFLLIALDQYSGTGEEENLINLQLTRDEIASSVGTSHETVTRYMSSFKSKGFIKEDKNWIYVLTPEGLRQFSDSRKAD